MPVLKEIHQINEESNEEINEESMKVREPINMSLIGDRMRNKWLVIISTNSQFFHCQSNRTHNVLYSQMKYCQDERDC